MRRIDDIERMSLEDLEKIASDSSVKVPEGLEEGIMDVIEASSAIEGMTEARRPVYLGVMTAIAAALALVLVLNMPEKEPKDTFSDPQLAYLELQKTLDLISSKMEKGMAIASQAEPVFEKTTNVLNKIN